MRKIVNGAIKLIAPLFILFIHGYYIDNFFFIGIESNKVSADAAKGDVFYIKITNVL